MERFTKVIILLMIATIPAAAPRDFATVPNLCFNAGSTTFQFSPSPKRAFASTVSAQCATSGTSRNEKVPQMLVGDPARLRQVLLNVAGNAVKFTEQGGIALTIELEAERDAVRFSVRDTGIGIAGEAQERIFLEFEQGDTTRQLDGAGLGLAICNRGNIGVESAPELPAASDQPRLFNRANLTGADILIVAPVFITASLLSRRLMDWGARTCMVPDLAPAKLHLSQRYWRAVMVDFGLGLETCEFVARETPSSMRRIAPITPSQRNVLPVLKQAGFDYLVKPIRAASLAAPHGYRPGEPGTRRRVHGRST